MESSEDEEERGKRLSSQRKRRINLIKRTFEKNSEETPCFRPGTRFEDGRTFSDVSFEYMCERKQKQTNKARATKRVAKKKKT